MIARTAFLVAAAVALACGPDAPGQDAGDPSDLPEAHAAFASCTGAAFVPPAARGWDHDASDLVSLSGAPGHSVQDPIDVDGAGVVLHGKFAYGALSLDLEGERIRAYVHDCAAWRVVGEAVTDSDGRVAFALTDSLAPGTYDVRLVALGDASVAPGRIWILPPGTRVAVTDIDGTLTTSDGELVRDVITDFFAPIYAGGDVPSAYPGAAALTRALSGRGHVVLYLTGRPYWLAGKTRGWLRDGGFAPGPLHTTDSNLEALPTDDGVRAYKQAYLERLAADGLLLDEAYGNAGTDVHAYAGAGIAAGATWIIGPNGGDGGTNAVPGSWEERAAAVAALPPIAQPFDR